MSTIAIRAVEARLWVYAVPGRTATSSVSVPSWNGSSTNCTDTFADFFFAGMVTDHRTEAAASFATKSRAIAIGKRMPVGSVSP